MAMLTCTQEQLMAGLRAAAAVEALYTAEDFLRRYHYTKEFQPGVDLAEFDNGGGDDLFVLSSSDGVIIKGFDHESGVSPYANDEHSPWPGIFEGVPPSLLRLLDEPAVNKDDLTFLHWRAAGGAAWSRGPVKFSDGEDDGSGWLLPLLPLTADDYIAGARDYFEGDFDKIDSAVIYRHFGG
jgi:hypothetical protein